MHVLFQIVTIILVYIRICYRYTKELLATGNGHCSLDVLYGYVVISEEELENTETEPLNNTLDKKQWYAKQKHLGCNKRRGQSKAAVT